MSPEADAEGPRAADGGAPARVELDEAWLPRRICRSDPHARRAFLLRFARGYGRRIAIVGALATAFFALDQVSKLIASIVPPDHFVSHDVAGLQIWAAVVPIFVVALFAHPLLMLGGGLLVGGTLGNAVDARFWPGGVPDFIDAPYPFTPPSIWNLADAFIDLGAIVYVVVLVVLTLRRVACETRAAQAHLSG